MVAEKWSKKIDYFTRAIMEEVKRKKYTAKHQLANGLSKNVSDKISKAEIEINNKINEVRRMLSRESNTEIANAIIEAKREFEQIKKRHINQLMEDIEDDLLKFTKSPEYENFVIQHIEQITKNNSFSTILIGATNMPMDRIKKYGLTVVESDIAGFILLSENKKISANYTLKSITKKFFSNEHNAPWNR